MAFSCLRYFLVASAIQQVLALPVECGTSPKTLQFATGRYEGYHDSNTSTTVYYGIPYAFAERFQAPHSIDVKPGNDAARLVNATAHAPACYNFPIPPPLDKGFQDILPFPDLAPYSEDCLTLDIYIPDGEYKDDLPILFWTHGGGLLQGTSWMYDLAPMVQRGVEMGKPFIGVATNYRLGPFGFLNPSTSKDWNLGVMDQFEAMRFVHKHAHSFGGDPSKVTISGESGGAESGMYQFLFANEELFRAVWLMSITSVSPAFVRFTPNNKDEIVQALAGAAGCSDNDTIASSVGCLETVSPEKILDASAAWEGTGSSFGGVVRANVFETIRAGNYPRVPVVFSTTRDEGTALALGFNSSDDETTSFAAQMAIGGAQLSEEQKAEGVKRILDAYPIDPALGCPFDGQNTTYGLGSQYKRMAAIYTDAFFAEAWVEYLETLSEHTDIWGLHWEVPLPGKHNPAIGVIHGSDLPYYFPNIDGPRSDPRILGRKATVDETWNGLINFVTELDPNGKNSDQECAREQKWPLFKDHGLVARLTEADGVVAGPPPHRPGFDVIREVMRPDNFGPNERGNEVGTRRRRGRSSITQAKRRSACD